MAPSVRMLAGIAAAALLFRCAVAATTIVVGAPNGGWDLSTDLQTWAASQKFTAGDTLVFRYDSTHTVLEVAKADYDACGTGNGIGSYSDGNTAVTLANPGKRYFICGVPGHCPAGMKLEVDVAGAAPSAPPPPAAAPPSPAATPPSAPEITPPPTPAAPPPVSSPSNGAPETSPFPSITPPPAPAPSTAGTEVPPSPGVVTPAQPPSAAGTKSPPSPGSRVAPEPAASGRPSGTPPPTAAGKVSPAAAAPAPSAAKTLELSTAAGIICMLLMRLVL